MEIASSQVVLRFCMSLISCHSEVFHCLHKGLVHSFSMEIAMSQVALRFCMSLISCHSVVLHCLHKGLVHSSNSLVESSSKLETSLWVVVIHCKCLQFIKCKEIHLLLMI